jgi:hypothetical protein
MNAYPPDNQQRLFSRTYNLFARDLDTIHRLREAHSFRTAAEVLSYLLRKHGESELERMQSKPTIRERLFGGA